MLSSQLPAVHRGVLFENQALNVLQKYFSMSLHRVGGKDDGGVDLRGWWWLPPLNSLAKYSTTTSPPASAVSNSEKSTTENLPRSRIRVIAQCKAEKKKMGPGYVREMEGVLHRYLHAPGSLTPNSPKETNDEEINQLQASTGMSFRSHPTVALIVSASPFTKAAVLSAFSSTLPFLLLHLPFMESRVSDTEELLSIATQNTVESEQPGSVFWNNALASGVLGDELELRWERFGDLHEVPQGRILQNHGRPGLWWNKKPVENWVPQEL